MLLSDDNSQASQLKVLCSNLIGVVSDRAMQRCSALAKALCNPTSLRNDQPTSSASSALSMHKLAIMATVLQTTIPALITGGLPCQDQRKLEQLLTCLTTANGQPRALFEVCTHSL